eukprot:55406-Eustigmatos_ZCMA.PRE.1
MPVAEGSNHHDAYEAYYGVLRHQNTPSSRPRDSKRARTTASSVRQPNFDAEVEDMSQGLSQTHVVEAVPGATKSVSYRCDKHANIKSQP